jgi:hypothetical protein
MDLSLSGRDKLRNEVHISGNDQGYLNALEDAQMALKKRKTKNRYCCSYRYYMRFAEKRVRVPRERGDRFSAVVYWGRTGDSKSANASQKLSPPRVRLKLSVNGYE